MVSIEYHGICLDMMIGWSMDNWPSSLQTISLWPCGPCVSRKKRGKGESWWASLASPALYSAVDYDEEIKINFSFIVKACCMHLDLHSPHLRRQRPTRQRPFHQGIQPTLPKRALDDDSTKLSVAKSVEFGNKKTR